MKKKVHFFYTIKTFIFLRLLFKTVYRVCFRIEIQKMKKSGLVSTVSKSVSYTQRKRYDVQNVLEPS
jgi:hypothetical protein